MENTPEIQTERLILRRFVPEDAQALFRLLSDEQVNTFLPMLPLKSLAEAEQHLQDDYLSSYAKPSGFRYAICLKSDSIPVGYVDVADNDSNDLGYALRKEYWHNGIVTEACAAVVEKLKDNGVPYITATHDVNNPRSGNVMKRIGMSYCYSYEELWQPKNIEVIFRMYQLNLDGQQRIYEKYRKMYRVNFVEANI
jgi:Acetyltransferases, including N-acetylases of ribosomal proteins